MGPVSGVLIDDAVIRSQKKITKSTVRDVRSRSECPVDRALESIISK